MNGRKRITVILTVLGIILLLLGALLIGFGKGDQTGGVILCFAGGVLILIAGSRLF